MVTVKQPRGRGGERRPRGDRSCCSQADGRGRCRAARQQKRPYVQGHHLCSIHFKRVRIYVPSPAAKVRVADRRSTDVSDRHGNSRIRLHSVILSTGVVCMH